MKVKDFFFGSIFFKRKPQPLNLKFKTIRIGNFHLAVNVEHRIGEYLTEHKYYSKNLPRIAKIIEDKYSTYSIVDVGANIGDTVALLRTAGVEQFIYCIEGEPKYFNLLQHNAQQFSNLKLFENFLGEQSKEEHLAIDANEGTARLSDDTSATISLKKLDDFSKRYRFKNVKLLKIDTDGFDLKIIRGGINFIRKKKPVLFFEYDSAYLEQQHENAMDIFSLLKLNGYSSVIFYDNYGRLLDHVSLDNMKAISEHYDRMKNKTGGFQYYDVCAFHKADSDLADSVYAKERLFFEEEKR